MRNWKTRAANLILSGVCAITPCVYAAPASMFTTSAEESFTEQDILCGYTYHAYNLGNVGKYEFANTVDNCFRVEWEKTQESSFSKGKNFDDEQYYAADFEDYHVEYDADVNFDGACTLSVSGFMEEPKLPKVEDLYGMKFEAQDGSIVMVRKAFKPRGKLEFYQPAE